MMNVRGGVENEKWKRMITRRGRKNGVDNEYSRKRNDGKERRGST